MLNLEKKIKNKTKKNTKLPSPQSHALFPHSSFEMCTNLDNE